MMFADAVKFEVLAIQPETRLGIELKVTETSSGLHFIHHLTTDYQLRAYLIDIWVLTRPLPWLLDAGRLTSSIKPRILYCNLLLGRILVVHFHLTIVYIHAPMLYVYRMRLREPHMTIDAAATIPTGVWLVAIVYPYRHHILAFFHVWRNIIFERTVAVWSVPDFLAVDIDCRIHIYPIELNKIAVIGR